MALLDALNRTKVWAQLMRDGGIGGLGISKDDLKAAVDATDAWIESNQSDYNVALPQPFRNSATLVQKTLLFCFVAMRRAGRLRVEDD